jgi:hypothetical protein
MPPLNIVGITDPVIASTVYPAWTYLVSNPQLPVFSFIVIDAFARGVVP